MTKEHKKYTVEFKQEAIKAWEANDRRSRVTGEQLGLYPSIFLKWHRQLEQRQAGPETCPTTQAQAQPVAATTELAAELKRLQRENTRLKMEHDILKKALGIFSEIPK